MNARAASCPGLIRNKIKRLVQLALILAALLLTAGCDDMENQPKFEPLEESQLFPDRRSARPLPTGVVARAEGVEDPEAYSARDENGELIDSFPYPVTLEVLQRGRERYDVFCGPCHGQDGYGQGMIVQRGFSPPPSLHEERLRQAPAGHIYEVITLGFGRMYAYDDRVQPADRWAIVAYVRALQLSQYAAVQDLPADELQNLQETSP
jgi:hypothetical protein